MHHLLRTPDDVTLSVQIEGSGSAIVLIHGWSMSGRFFQRQLPDLSSRHRVIVPDIRGHGRSEKVLRGHTIPTYASDLRAVLVELAVERPLLVGWSMGATIAYEYLRQYGPGSVSGLVVVDEPPSNFGWEDYEFGGATLAELHAMSEQIQTDQQAAVLEFTPEMLHQADDDTVAWMTAEILQVPPAIASTILYDQVLRDYRDFLPQITVPVLVLFGEDEKRIRVRAGRYLADTIPNARLRTFPRSGHCPFWEEADAFNQAVAAFAAEVA